MQKGQFQPTVPLLLVAFAILLISATGTFAKPYDVGPLLSVKGVAGAGNSDAKVYIGTKLPPLVRTKQSGPDPDRNLTSTASLSFELQPTASPNPNMNRIVFSTNGVDADVFTTPGAPGTPSGQLDPTAPAADADYDLWIMRTDGSWQSKVMKMAGDQVDPCYNPGGTLLVFSTRVNGVWQLATIPVADPSIVTYLTTGPGNKRHPTWSPDSNWIAFQSDVNGTWDIFKIRASGTGAPVALTSGAANDTSPCWANTGSRIAYARETAAVSRIYTVNPDDGTVEQLSNGGGDATASDIDPAWQPGAASIAFSSNRLTDPADTIREYNVFRMPAAGEVAAAPVTLVSNTSLADTTDDTDPTWTVEDIAAPNRIVFVSKRVGGQPDIWANQTADTFVPNLMAFLPGEKIISAVPRVTTPGNEVTISVGLYDEGTGIRQVMARFKDPDMKLYDLTSHGTLGIWFDTNFQAGTRRLEMDCQYVGQIELLDDDNDGIFTGTYTVPPAENGGARDYIIDIRATDRAGNAITYDDIYGFSARTFAHANNILFVDDYCEGQSWISTLYHHNNDFAMAWPIESYYTYNPGTVAGGVDTTVDYDSIAGPYHEGYDTWRVICRGPISAGEIGNYLPTSEMQLDPAALAAGNLGELEATRKVPVARGCVVWASPHCGRMLVSDGNIDTPPAQNVLRNFMAAGGRLFISGEDIAWALTTNTATNGQSFLRDVLHASFVRDTPPYNYWGSSVNYGGYQWDMMQNANYFAVVGLASDPVSGDAWVASNHDHVGDAPNWYHAADRPFANNTSRAMPYPANTPQFDDAASYAIWPDEIAALGGDKLYGLAANENTGATFADAPTCGLKYVDPATSSRLVYLSFGFEQLNRGYHPSEPGIPSHCKNVRSHLLHNFACWSRTGGLQGIALSITDGGAPVTDPEPIVVATSVQGGTTYRYAVRCQKDGTWIMQGLPPGEYSVYCTLTGRELDKFEAEWVHGGQIAREVNFEFARPSDGGIAGKVTAADGTPLANVWVSVAVDPTSTTTDPNTELPVAVQTAADGTYLLSPIPPGEYIVTADGTSILYEKQDQEAAVVIGDTTQVDFALAAANGTLVANVTNITNGAPIFNALVTVTDATNKRYTARTDDAGSASVSLAPGNYSVVVTASGFGPSASQTFSVEPTGTYPIDFALTPEAGGTIRGRVVAGSSSTFVAGVSIRVYSGTEELTGGTTSAAAIDPSAAVTYNYEIKDVPTGEVTVVAERPGFTSVPASRTVTITTATVTGGVNFSMQSLHTFPVGLQLVSLPWDYSSIDPATLLGRTSLTMATWESSRQRYRLYPDAPADRFRLGTGYWMKLPAKAELSQEGVAGTDPVEIPLSPGWNLIGCPYNKIIDYAKSKARDGLGTVISLQEARSRGLIASALYAYIGGSYIRSPQLAPFTGYWLRAYEPCSLIISEQDAMQGAAVKTETAPEVSGGWVMQLKAAVGRVKDTSTYVGLAPAATSGCDFDFDQPKPPVPAMGEYVYAAVDNSDWASFGGDYAVDVRPAGQKSVFNLNVSTNMVGRQVKLTWGDLSGLPNSVRPLLVDPQTGKQVYMRTTAGYVFTATKDVRRLQVVVDAPGGGTLAITPLAASGAGAGTAISYTLSQAAAVDVTVCNIAGRVVRQVVSGQLQSAGANTVLWDGRDARGVQVPAGQYFVSICGRADSGQQVQSIMPLQKVVR